ncbi:MAG: type II toxin-antitoxin system prevent-host-death family antitoxin [Proteobacteria bacterium]|nr:type II toxin-antitoxin system prevent-host-death family antitoxin [Pseudomonadota bacterium]
MVKINIGEAKAHFSRYIESVERGETVTICRRNVPVAEIRPLPQPLQERRPTGIDRGMNLPSSFFEPLPEDLLTAFQGETGSSE